MNAREEAVAEVPPEVYQLLADFRHRIREFLRFSEEAARSFGMEPQQHQMLLSIKGLPSGARPTIRNLAERLCLRHNSTVELVNRLAERGAVSRVANEQDRREVLVRLTSHGEELLAKLSMMHWQELRARGPALAQALQAVLKQAEREGLEGSQHQATGGETC